MQTCDTVSALRGQIQLWRQTGRRIAFVPTMGNLHAGHISLVNIAKAHAEQVVASIFVNPLQFDDKADLAAYPRTVEADIEQLDHAGCDLVFLPAVEDIYPDGMAKLTQIHVPELGDILCGRHRPGHFDGVATVVAKLFNMVQPDVAVLGEKDYQQLLLIKKMVRDLNIAVDVIGTPIVREESGLAMSSRNQYLDEQERAQAARLYQSLLSIKAQLEQGARDYPAIQQAHIARLRQQGFQPDYIEIRRARDLALPAPTDKALRILAAARLGKARLIDNIACYLA